MTGAREEPAPSPGDDPDRCWQTPPEMSVGRWIEVPVAEDGPPLWMRVEELIDPGWSDEHRWAVRAGRDGEQLWMKIAPWLRFRSAGRDPAGTDENPG